MSSTQYVDVNRTLQNLEDSSLHPENTQAVRDFLDHCAAQGISEVRQQRYAQSWKALIQQFAPNDFRLYDASEQELKTLIAGLNRSADYADTSKETMRSAVKKFYKFANGGHEHPDKVKFFTVRNGGRKASSVSQEDLFTTDELKRLLRGFSSTRDRAFTLMLYESGCRPGELLSRNIGDFTSNEKGDFIYLEGSKETPDRTNQLVRAGRTVREWLAQHPLGGALGEIDNPSAPLWVKTEQQTCLHCGEIPHQHGNDCDYEPDLRDRLNYGSFLRRFKAACKNADIPANKRRPYNLRHTRLTEVATFMGYEQLNKFAGWVPGSTRAKVYVHLNNEDVNKAIRDQYGLDEADDGEQSVACPFCETTNQPGHSECRRCGRPLSLQQQVKQEEDLTVLEQLQELEEKGVLDKLDQLETMAEHASSDEK